MRILYPFLFGLFCEKKRRLSVFFTIFEALLDPEKRGFFEAERRSSRAINGPNYA
jgi:hypothetical protein